MAWDADTLGQLPEIVREERRRRGLSVRQAANEMGYSFADLTRFELGRKDARLSTVIKMLNWLDEEREQ